MNMSAGKLWGMRRMADSRGLFKMTAVDQRPPIKGPIAKHYGVTEAPYADVARFKALLIQTLQAQSSAMLLDPHFAIPVGLGDLSPQKGLIVTLEDSVFEDTGNGRRSSEIDHWSVNKIKRMGGDAVKVLAWYRPDADPKINAHQQDYVKRIGEACDRYDIPFLFELLVYPLAKDAEQTKEYVEMSGKKSDDVLASLATSGPFAMYLRRGSTVEHLERVGLGAASPDDYVIDMTVFDDHPVKPGLLAPGGVAVFSVDGERLRTTGIVHGGELHTPGGRGFARASRVFLCAMNTHLTTLVHNVTIHLGLVTPMTVASTNELAPDHPIRRLLHPAFQNTLSGNHELALFQIIGEGSFATRLFSHEYPTLVAIINDHLRDFRPVDLDPERAFAQQGLVGAPISLPFWDDDLALWEITLSYVERYVQQYYDSDEAVADDAQVAAWAATLDHLLPSGLYDDLGYLEAGAPLTRATLGRLCASFLHTSWATHDVVNNAVWDYSTLNYVVPTVVPESLRHQDVRLSFDFMNTILGTWKPFNMVIDGLSALALDDAGRAIMDDVVDALKARQAVMEAEPRRAGRIYPADLNTSVSN